MSTTKLILESARLSRRTLLKGAAAGAVAAAATGFGYMPAIAAGTRTLKITVPDFFSLLAVKDLTEAPAKDGTWKLATWTVLQGFKQQYPDVDLDVTETPWDQITQRVILDAQSGSQSDVVMVNDLNIPKLADGNFLMPLDDFDGKWDEYNQYLLRGIASRNGKIYGMPLMTDCRHETYWLADFDKAGIKAPAETWADFADQLSALKDAGFENPYAFWMGNSVHTPTQTIFAPLWMLDSDVIDKDGHATLNTDAMHKVFDFYDDLVNKRQVVRKDLVSISSGDEYDAILTGHKTSVMKEGSWVWTQLAASGMDKEMGYFRTPRPTADAKDATLSGFWAFEIPTRDDRDPDMTKLAFELGAYFSSVASQASIVGNTDGQLPTRPAAVDTPEGKSKGDAWAFQAKYAGDSGRGMPPAGDSGLLFDQIRIAFQQFITGALSADDALKAAETAYNSQLS